MKKYLAIALLMSMATKAEAHDHPGIDNLTHSLEHLLIGYEAWLPYLVATGLSFAAATLLRSRRIRHQAASVRSTK